MGREAKATARWMGKSGTVTALLEPQEIILRGDVRARIARASITAMSVEGDTLTLMAADETLSLELGPAEAGKWRDTLSKPLPTLAQKLGVTPASPAFVLGAIHDAELQRALAGTTAASVGSSAMIIAILTSEADLTPAVDLARASRLPLWCIAGKGKFATVSEAMIRTYARSHGLRDNKSCAVSERLTATRYVWPKA